MTIKEQYELAEKNPFLPRFWTRSQAEESVKRKYIGKPFKVLNRHVWGEIPAWLVRFEDGAEVIAFQEEIIGMGAVFYSDTTGLFDSSDLDYDPLFHPLVPLFLVQKWAQSLCKMVGAKDDGDWFGLIKEWDDVSALFTRAATLSDSLYEYIVTGGNGEYPGYPLLAEDNNNDLAFVSTNLPTNILDTKCWQVLAQGDEERGETFLFNRVTSGIDSGDEDMYLIRIPDGCKPTAVPDKRGFLMAIGFSKIEVLPYDTSEGVFGGPIEIEVSSKRERTMVPVGPVFFETRLGDGVCIQIRVDEKNAEAVVGLVVDGEWHQNLLLLHMTESRKLMESVLSAFLFDSDSVCRSYCRERSVLRSELVSRLKGAPEEEE